MDKGNKPSYIVYNVDESTKPVRWQEVGVAFEHKDNDGGSIFLNALPLSAKWDGKLVYRKLEDREVTQEDPTNVK